MSEPPRRVIMEKSRTVRRRYQRNNKRLQFTPSQIARIERDQERERRAKQLQEKEKKRIANKKKKAHKEAQEREERRRQGLPDPNAFRVPSSQPLLSKFLAKPKTDSPPIQTESSTGEDGHEDEGEGETPCEDDTEPDTPGSVETEADPFEMPELGAEATAEDLMVAIDSTTDDLKTHTHDTTEYNGNEDNEDEFSDCSAFYDEDLIRETEIAAIAQDHSDQKVPQEAPQTKRPVMKPALEESFRDDTADFLEEFAGDFYADEDFEKELTKLDAV